MLLSRDHKDTPPEDDVACRMQKALGIKISKRKDYSRNQPGVFPWCFIRKMDPLLKRVLFALNMVGLSPFQRNGFAKIRCFLAFTTAVLVIVSSLLLVAFEWRGIQTFSSIYMLPSIVMFLAKMVTLLVNMKQLKRLVDHLDAFWPVDKFGEDIGNKINKLHKKIFVIVSSLIIAVGLLSVILVITPLFLNNKTLIFQGYFYFDVRTSPYFEIVHVCQSLSMMFQMLPAVPVGFDCLFICFLGKCYSGIELLKYALKEISDEEDEVKQAKKIAKFCQQHSFILNFVSEMNEFYGGLMLIQTWSSLGALIFSLYMITSEGMPPALSILVQYGALYYFLSMQLFYYCVGGTIISYQTLSISDEVYNVDWYKKTQPKFRQKLTFVIQRSQKAQKLKVGNMMDLDLECFVRVMRNAFSVYTLMRTIEQ